MRRPSPYLGPVHDEPLPVELLNTVYLASRQRRDGLESPADLAAWLDAVRPRLETPISARALAGTDEADLEVARDLRDCIKRLVHARATGHRPSRTDLERLNRRSRSAPRWPELRWTDSPELAVVTDAEGVAAALSEIAQDAMRLLAEAGPTSIRVCGAPGCILYFVKGHPRRAWCSDSCGNRVRAARHYTRTRQLH